MRAGTRPPVSAELRRAWCSTVLPETVTLDRMEHRLQPHEVRENTISAAIANANARTITLIDGFSAICTPLPVADSDPHTTATDGPDPVAERLAVHTIRAVTALAVHGDADSGSSFECAYGKTRRSLRVRGTDERHRQQATTAGS